MPKHRPERVPLVVHVGDASDNAVLIEWWKPLDGDVETRAVRFYDKDLWLPDDELPDALRLPGCRISDVVEMDDHPGLANPLVAAGHRLHLQPQPDASHGPDAIAVLSDDRVKIGYLPADVATATMAESHRVRSAFGALVLTEHRDAETQQRVGLRILVGPGRVWAEELSE